MLSSVLRSERAIRVNIAIMRAFVRLRQVLGDHQELARKLAELESRVNTQDESIRDIMDAIHRLIECEDEAPGERIGFHPPTPPDA